MGLWVALGKEWSLALASQNNDILFPDILKDHTQLLGGKHCGKHTGKNKKLILHTDTEFTKILYVWEELSQILVVHVASVLNGAY